MSKDHPLILSVDTATTASSVSITAGDVYSGECIASLILNSKITHSRRLLTCIEWLLSESDISIHDIDGVAVGLGPGSFTGLRIAMATVKGIALAAEKPLLGISTLDALALNCSGSSRVCAVIDARKKEVYTAYFQRDSSGVVRRKGEIRAIAPEQLAAEIEEPVLLVGDGVFTYGELFQKRVEGLLTIAPLPLHYPMASAIGFLCAEKLAAGDLLDLETAAPLYVRASDAELSLVTKKDPKI